MNALSGRPAYWAMAAGAVLVALASYRFLPLGLDASFATSPIFIAWLEQARPAFAAHVIAAPIALALGALQLHRGLRNRSPALHRWSGRAYALSVLVGGAAGLSLAVAMVEQRPIAGVGFGLLSLLWIATTALGVQAARRRRFDVHRAWMTYAFALTFSAVTLRVQLFAFQAAGVDYEAASGFLAWSCWVPNLIFAWFQLRARKTARLAQSMTPVRR